MIDNYKTLGEDKNRLVEINTRTGEKHSYRKDAKGRVDPKYLKVHRQDILQPYGKNKREFEKVYGKEAMESV